jgi:nicotinamide-nucleotide amidase
MAAEVITIGSEILAGHTLEGNLLPIVRALAAEGVPVTRHVVVPDERAAVAEAIRLALGRSRAVLVTGGLGATPDDLTRGVLASLLGRKLTLREGLLAEIRRKHEARGREMSPAAEVMALLPAGAHALANRLGLAPGFHLETDGRHLFALPGVCAEMRAMLREEVLPRLRAAGLGTPRPAHLLRIVGIPETNLAQEVEPRLGERVTVAYLPSAGRVDLRLAAPPDPDGEVALQQTLARLTGRLGVHIYARDETSLEASLLALLAERGLSLAVAESLTGGLLGGALTRVPGSSRAYLGDIVAYSNTAKETLLSVSHRVLAQEGAVSAATARAMAQGARRALGASVGVSTTGIAGPSGGSAEKPVGLVYFGLCDGRRQHSFRYRLGGDRAMIQDLSVTLALNMLRLHLLGRLDSLAAHEVPAAPPASRRADGRQGRRP